MLANECLNFICKEIEIIENDFFSFYETEKTIFLKFKAAPLI